MENLRLFMLRIILASIILSIVIAHEEKKKTDTNLSPLTDSRNTLKAKTHSTDITKPIKRRKNSTKSRRKHLKKSKRDAYGNYGKYWGARSSNYGYGGYSSNMPLYLVYNRKVGAYYPYYKYPKENSVRRTGNFRKVPLQ